MAKGDRFQRFSRSEASVWTRRLWPDLEHYADTLFRLSALVWDRRAGCHETGPVRLCVQERLMCSAGDRPAGVRIGSPVAGRAGRRETNGPEAPRQPHLWDGGKLSGRNESEREVAPKRRSPEAEPATVRAKAARLVANRSTRQVAPAGWLATARRPGHIEQLEKPSSSRPERAEAG